ncbi:hypothetical protein IX51_04185 [uncultured archaeon]|nr:hypothetical protein IX51_04185 [uncultured archaeon]
MIDISLPLNRDLITYPGDAKYEEYEYYTHEKNHVHIMRILMETHSGTHFDAPYHMIPDGMKADEIDLDRFIGKATIVKVDGNSIDAEDIPDSHNEIVLFKTRNSEMYDRFDTTFTYLSPEGADKLVDHNVKLVGIDYLSIEKFGSHEPVVHRKLLGNDVVIIEGLNMKDVIPGDYEFICLPLRMSEDGAPCRAVLR